MIGRTLSHYRIQTKRSEAAVWGDVYVVEDTKLSRKVALTHARTRLPNPNEGLRLFVGQRAQKHRVHSAEHRRIEPNAESEGYENERGESRPRQEIPNGVFEIRSQRVHVCTNARVEEKFPFSLRVP